VKNSIVSIYSFVLLLSTLTLSSLFYSDVYTMNRGPNSIYTMESGSCSPVLKHWMEQVKISENSSGTASPSLTTDSPLVDKDLQDALQNIQPIVTGISDILYNYLYFSNRTKTRNIKIASRNRTSLRRKMKIPFTITIPQTRIFPRNQANWLAVGLKKCIPNNLKTFIIEFAEIKHECRNCSMIRDDQRDKQDCSCAELQAKIYQLDQFKKFSVALRQAASQQQDLSNLLSDYLNSSSKRAIIDLKRKITSNNLPSLETYVDKLEENSNRLKKINRRFRTEEPKTLQEIENLRNAYATLSDLYDALLALQACIENPNLQTFNDCWQQSVAAQKNSFRTKLSAQQVKKRLASIYFQIK